MTDKIDLSAYNRNNGLIYGYKTKLQYMNEEWQHGDSRVNMRCSSTDFQASHSPQAGKGKWSRHLPISNPMLPNSLAGVHHRRMDRFSDDKHGLLEQSAKNGHLTDEEAIHHYIYGHGEAITVDATRLLIYQENDFNADDWAKGIVQGDNDFAVHGKVNLFLQKSGAIHVDSAAYDYGWEDASDIFRNTATAARGAYIGQGVEYIINYEGTPRIIREGVDYTSSIFGH